MAFVLTLFNLWAFAALIVAAAIGGAMYSGAAPAGKRLGLMGSFTQAACLAVGGLHAVRLVTSDIALEDVGPLAGCVIMTALYGVLFNLACKVWARLVKESPAAPSA